MNKKSFFIICSTLIIASNLLMISVVNKGEETGSNLFVIAIACVLLPAFFICSWKQTYFNGKIGSTPEILNIIITLIALASGTAAILVAIMIIYENIRKWGWVVFYFVFSHCQVPPGQVCFPCLLFKFFNNSRCFDDHLWIWMKKNS